jgi:hypothetical protein
VNDMSYERDKGKARPGEYNKEVKGRPDE